MRPLRILQLVQKPQRRGAEVFAVQLSGELRRLGHHVRTLYLYPYVGPGRLPLEPGDRVLSGGADSVLDRLIGAHPGLLWRLRDAIEEFRPEVLQLNGGRTLKYGVLAGALLTGASPVLVYRNIGDPREWIRGPRRSLLYHWLVRRVDGVVAVSESALAHLREVHSLRMPAVVIRTGIDEHALAPARSRLEVRRAAHTGADSPVLLFVGSLSAEKRVDRALDALARVRRRLPDARLWIVGDGPLRPQLESHARELGLGSAVRFLGARSDVGCHLAAADLMVLLSDTEGVPAVLLEAGFFGVPVVASRVGGIPECVLDGETGLLVDPSDEEGVARAITGLLLDADARAAMGCRARDWIREHFRMAGTARDYVRLYHTALGRRLAVPRLSPSVRGAARPVTTASPADHAADRRSGL